MRTKLLRMRSSILLLSAALQVGARTLGKFARAVDAATASATDYDFVIAGGGIGGLTVADRLTEDPSSKPQSFFTMNIHCLPGYSQGSSD